MSTNTSVAPATSAPALPSAFAQLQLAEPLLRALADAGYTTPTPIQLQAIPLVLAGGDLLAAAQTGTGKTAGFTLPILHRLHTKPDHHLRVGRPRCLILTPTRELAAQVEASVQTYGKHLPMKSLVIFGGVGINPQIQALKRRVDILVATPGRLLDHVGQKTIDLSGVEILVLDEADRMLDMGFIHDIRKILALLPKNRQNLLFSATFSDEIKALADRLLNNPGCVEVARRNTASEQVSQTVHLVAQKQKRDVLAHLIKSERWSQVLVFTRTKHGANKLAEFLGKQNIAAAAIHGNKSQNARTQALAQFKAGQIPVLVATDIAARGLDIDQLPQVVNFELPNVPEDYVHRIGRTGRAGATGAAVSLVDQEEIKLLKGIEQLIKRSIERQPVQGFVAPPPSAQHDDEDRRPPRPARGAGQAASRSGNAGEPRRAKPGAGSSTSRGQSHTQGGHPTPDQRRSQGSRQAPAQPSASRSSTTSRSNASHSNGTAPTASHPRASQNQRSAPRAALFSAPPAGKNR